MYRQWPALVVSFFLFSGAATANPTGGVVVSGNAAITQSSGTTTINQNSQKVILRWNSFNIGAKEHTHFKQPKGGEALSRIDPRQGASQIYGKLTATGRIILINQAGVFFGPGSYVNVGGIIASTIDMTDNNFLAGTYIFDQPSAYRGSIINKGTLIAADHGLIALIGNNVSNEGLIHANTGSVVLASGKKFTVDLAGDELVNFTVNEGIDATSNDDDGKVMRDGVSNSGNVISNGGKIIMSAKSARNVLDHVINMEGVIQAKSVYEQDGDIILSAGDEGNTYVAGTIIATGDRGGKIKVLGNTVKLSSTANIDASGDTGGGEILIGGNYQGKGPEYNAQSTLVDKGAVLKANAIESGNGGKIIIWSNDDTRVYGNISARGGVIGGNGGLVETSGHYLDINGITVNLLAAHGKTGKWLLDPYNVTISSSSTNNGNFDNLDPNTFTPTGNNSIVNVDTLESNLENSDVEITTGVAGAQAGNITVNASIAWDAATTLTLTAAHDITINADITAFNGALTLNAESGTIGINTLNIYTKGDQIYNGPLTLGVSPILTSTASDIMLNNDIDGGGNSLTVSNAGPNSYMAGDFSGPGDFTKKGDGTLTFSGTNSYTGSTILDGGILQLNTSSALDGTSSIIICFCSILNLNNVTIANNTATIAQGGVIAGTGTLSINNPIILTDDTATIQTNANSIITLNGTINGPRSLTLAGDGSLVVASEIGALTPIASINANIAGDLTIRNVFSLGGQNYNASSITTTANSTFVADTGDITYQAPMTLGNDTTINALAGSVTLNNITGPYRINVTASNDIQLNGRISVNAIGDAISLASDRFLNYAGSSALNPGSGRFLVWSTSPADNVLGGIPYNFIQYNSPYPTPASSPGNGFLYSIAEPSAFSTNASFPVANILQQPIINVSNTENELSDILALTINTNVESNIEFLFTNTKTQRNYTIYSDCLDRSYQSSCDTIIQDAK